MKVLVACEFSGIVPGTHLLNADMTPYRATCCQPSDPARTSRVMFWKFLMTGGI